MSKFLYQLVTVQPATAHVLRS